MSYASRLRRQRRRARSYQDRIAELMARVSRGELTVPPGVHVLTVQHDADCPMLRDGSPCTCTPDMEIDLNGSASN